MIELTADDWTTVLDRQVAVFAAANQPSGVHPRSLIGQDVTIDGTVYTVTGLDHYAIVCPRSGADPTVCGHPYGLVVKEKA